MSFITVENVCKVYDVGAGAPPARVLEGISFEVAEGDFVALMGPSGSGKTTLLTVVGAMNRPTGGRVVVDGIDVYALSEERRADFRREYLGFVFQQHHLLPYLTAAENVMLPLATVRAPAREKRERALAVLERVGLGDKAARLPNQLSGGEQGRLAIARAVVNRPPLLLADEPTGALDTRTGEEVLGVLLDLNARGQTVMLVTHNPEAAARAGRVLHIRDGRSPTESAGGAGRAPFAAAGPEGLAAARR
ncbi:MAG TPA: ABC transporter ATP-binding protein [Pyrinomonadaceae bacterium]|jgi:putative ABC transport system ATP-binding protein